MVAANGARVRTTIVVLEARRWGKVQRSKGSRLAEQMPKIFISITNYEVGSGHLRAGHWGEVIK